MSEHEAWDKDKARELRGQAVRLLRDHGHSFHFASKDDEEMTRDSCGACVLAGWNDSTEDGPLAPNYAGWARVYVEAGRRIPAKYRQAFEDTRKRDDNALYVEGLERDIATFGLRFED